MKCPKCGHRWFELTKAGEEALEKLSHTKEISSYIRTCVFGCGKFKNLMKHYKIKHSGG